MNVVEIKNLSYKYPIENKEVLRDISLNIEKGKLYALIGHNGAGKTTLCNTIRGFIPHFYQGHLRGDVILEGKDIREWTLSELSQKVGYVFQNPFTQISGTKDTVYEEIAYGLENLGLQTKEIHKKVDEVLSLFHIEGLVDKNPFELSGGQKQRVALASIIVMEPEILVIDEPTSQLDPQGTEEVFKIIEIMKKKGKTIILVEHKIDLLAEYADVVVLLKDGEIVMQGETHEIFTDERVLSHKGALPQYALLGIEMEKQGLSIDQIPYTRKNAISTIREWNQLREDKK
ncbi:ABC transporter ATP-binding protein [Paenibacillus lautus]|uniref:energy-coupling factor ABC transporter ATP-binding protein n=1 Tax=Paenibacillus lautus TaxID=1401 RepID=UPI003D292C99